MVTDTPPRVTYNCNGSLQQFSFSFPIIVSSDLIVTLLNTVTNTATVMTETTHYAVTDSNGVSGVLANYANGGFVTTTIVPPYSSTYRITVERSVPYTQAADFTEGMQTLYETFEKAIDKLTMQVQQLKDRVNRSPYVPIVDSTSLDMELPNSGDRANKYFGFNSLGEPIAASITTTDLMVSAFGQNIVQATNAAAARTTLDFSAAVSAELLDEDNFASDSATKAPTQQSVKAYIGSAVGDLMEFTNLNFTATVGSKALTVALKGTDGNDPSASNKVTIPFRSATLTSAVITSRTVTSALSVVLSSGSTLGFTAALAGRIYVWAIDNAGTVELALSRTSDLYPEDALVTTTAEGGAGAADSASVMYSTTARSNVACRCIGYIEITTGATAGEWDNAPTKIQVMGPGVERDATTPWIIDIDAFNQATNTNWSAFTVIASCARNGARQSTGAQNDSVQWDVIIPAGTWSIVLQFYADTESGIYSVRLDGVEKGTIDSYTSGAGLPNLIGAITGVVVPSTKKYTLSLVMATKNAGSSAYKGYLQHVRLVRTA